MGEQGKGEILISAVQRGKKVAEEKVLKCENFLPLNC